MNTEQKIMKAINKNGLNEFIFYSFEEAEKSGFSYSIVLVADEKGNADLYFTGLVYGLYGEFASWNESELEEDEDLITTAIQGISAILTSSDPKEMINKIGFDFTPYL